MEEITPTKPTEQVESWLDSTSAKVAGAVAAVGFTLATLRFTISQAFFNTMNKGDKGVFKDLQHARDTARAEVTKPAIHRGEMVPDAMERVGKINKEYQVAYEERRKLLGIRKGVMGLVDETKALKYHQWVEVIFATAAVASVAVGAILAIGSNREVAQKQKEFEDKQEKKEQVAQSR